MTDIKSQTVIKDTIKVLQSQIDEEQRITNDKIDALNALKKLLPPEIVLSDKQEQKGTPPVYAQILSLFSNGIITHAIKKLELQKIYEREFKSKKNVTAGLPKLKKENKLVMIRYNRMKGSSFYGLPEWVDKNDFKDQYKPDKELLPRKIIESDIVNE